MSSGGGSSSGGSGVDWTKIGSALTSLSQGSGSSGSSSSGSSGSSVVGQSSSQTGRPANAASMDDLMKLLLARQQGLAQSAENPQSATPQTQTRGLLGY